MDDHIDMLEDEGKTIDEFSKTQVKDKKLHLQRVMRQDSHFDGPDLNVEYPYLDHRSVSLMQ